MSLPIPGALFVATVLASRSITCIAFWNRRCWQECKFWGLNSNGPRLIKLHMSSLREIFPTDAGQLSNRLKFLAGQNKFLQDRRLVCYQITISFCQKSQDICQTNWNFLQDRLKICQFCQTVLQFSRRLHGDKPVYSLKYNQVFIPIISESRESSGWHWRRELKKQQQKLTVPVKIKCCLKYGCCFSICQMQIMLHLS